MSSPRYLTKSRFTLGNECPTKLYYTRKKDIYADKSLDDDFLKALAKGGLQVGELAKLYYPGGVEIESANHEEALQQTEELLNMNNVILYEPAFRFENLFIRVDVLVKEGNKVKLIEVKSKSYSEDEKIVGARGGVLADWKKYIYDVSFQKYVLQNSHPKYNIVVYLMLPNKDKVASVNELYGKFVIRTDERDRVFIEVLQPVELGDQVLTAMNVDEIVNKIINGTEEFGGRDLPFSEYVKELSEAYRKDERILQSICTACKNCQFRLTSPIEEGLRSGFHECLKLMANAKEEDMNRPTIFDVWYLPTKNVLDHGKYYQDQLTKDDLNKPKDDSEGLDRHSRQVLQMNYAKSKDNKPYIDYDGLAREMEKILYPLNFIDFETTLVPIPFFTGNRPYEAISFQFSHHTLHKDGKLHHESQYLHSEPGVFPNFEFVRELKKSLEKNEGSIFRYADHENNIMNAIYRQLDNSSEPDKEGLMEWIKTVTEKSSENHFGSRNMIDQLKWVHKYYWHPMMGGSNSIKVVLPASLNESEFLREKYKKPIYGTLEIFSHNLRNHIWIEEQDGKVVNPYKQLPKLFNKYDRDLLDERLSNGDELADGGAAMTAYNYMQFRQMQNLEREEIKKALFRYCELDTLAMVMIFEYWRELSS